MKYPEKYYRLFFGKNADYFIHVMSQFETGKKTVFNVYAFFFGLMWLLYRQMYLIVLIVWCIMLFENQIETLLVSKYDFDFNENSGWLLVSTTLWATIFGFFGNTLYIRHTEKTIGKIIEMNLDEQSTEDLMIRKGGITFIPHLLLILLLSIIVALGKKGLIS